MRAALRRFHWRLSLGIGFLCLIIAQWTGPAAMLVLFVVGCGLMFDGVTILWAQVGRAGGLHDHRQ